MALTDISILFDGIDWRQLGKLSFSWLQDKQELTIFTPLKTIKLEGANPCQCVSSQPNVIRDLNQEFQINPDSDTDVCRDLAGFSHFAECRESVLMLFTKNCRNSSMLVETTACQIWRIFLSVHAYYHTAKGRSCIHGNHAALPICFYSAVGKKALITLTPEL